MQDWYSNDEATAAMLAVDDARYYDNERGDEHVLPVTAPHVTGNPLVNAVNTALVWSGALCGRWTPADLAQTAPDVVAFTLAPADDPQRIYAALVRDGFEALVREGRMFVRRAVAGAA